MTPPVGPEPTGPYAQERAVTRRIGACDLMALDAEAAVGMIRDAVIAARPQIFGFCNAHTVNMTRADAGFAAAVGKATLFNDGIGVDLASRILYGMPFPANLNGTDLTPALLAALPAGTRVFLLGSPADIAARARDILSGRYPTLSFVGAENGFFGRAEESALAARIRALQADLVLVGMGHPHQELWAARNLTAVGAVLICVGAFFDFTAGAVPRAPGWVRAARAEWVYRLFREPRRMARRYLLGNITFLAAVIRQRMAARRP